METALVSKEGRQVEERAGDGKKGVSDVMYTHRFSIMSESIIHT